VVLNPRHNPGEHEEGVSELDNNAIGVLVILAILAFLVIIFLAQSIRIIQQGYVGVVKRVGRFHRLVNPGITAIVPFIDTLARVDMRELPRPGDRQEVITKDNVLVAVNATVFTQVIDAAQALFSISNFDVALDQLARTALRSVIGTMTLDEVLSERERMNTSVQEQMEQVTDKWGITIKRIEIVDITPPAQILQAMALQKQADQEKRARILQSEGQQQSAVNIADGNRQAAIKQAEGEKQAAILRAEGNRQAAILEAEGRAQAITTVYSSITAAHPDPTLVAILQLDTLSKFADSDNTKIVIPQESAALMGAAQAVRSVLADVPTVAPPATGSGSA
jgi:regulator of protease activity HflC (stomatin/prohibitin superfamily)